MNTATHTRGEPLRGERFDASRLGIGVLMGGRSSEREISLWSGRGVASALRGELDPALRARLPREVLAIEIEGDGRWSFSGETSSAHEALARTAAIDVFFVCLHGGDGEDGTLQGFFDTAGRRYTGSGVRASALCMDKQATRALAISIGVRVADGLCISARAWRDDEHGALARVRALAHDGWVLKPRCGGSSVATSIVHDAAALAAAAVSVFATGDELLVEARVAGVELSCGVLGLHDGDVQALTPIEIQPADGRFFDYEQKYSSDGARELCPPRNAGAGAVARVRELAERVHRVAGCDGYSRSDWIVPDGAGEPVLLEINTLPGLTARSLLPQEAAVHGASYTELCLRILGFALQRQRAGASA